MSTTDLSGATWRKSTRSNGQASCVEVADLGKSHRAVRDSKNPTGAALIFAAVEWAAFTADVHGGRFD